MRLKSGTFFVCELIDEGRIESGISVTKNKQCQGLFGYFTFDFVLIES